MTNPVICEHGSYYAGECYRCEIALLATRIAELEAENNDLRELICRLEKNQGFDIESALAAAEVVE